MKRLVYLFIIAAVAAFFNVSCSSGSNKAEEHGHVHGNETHVHGEDSHSHEFENGIPSGQEDFIVSDSIKADSLKQDTIIHDHTHDHNHDHNHGHQH